MFKIKEMLAARVENRKSEKGFSLIDVVVTVAIVVALSVGGFFAYTGLVHNAKQGAVDFAASNVYKSAVAYENSGDPTKSACSAVDEYNDSSTGIEVQLMVPESDAPGAAVGVYYGPGGNPDGGENTYNCA